MNDALIAIGVFWYFAIGVFLAIAGFVKSRQLVVKHELHVSIDLALSMALRMAVLATLWPVVMALGVFAKLLGSKD